MLYGWDVSTSIVGLCAFDDTGVLQTHHHLDLRSTDGLLAKADEFKGWLEGMAWMNDSDKNVHFIEERLGGFSGGRTSAQVLMKLAQFNALCSYIIWNHHVKPGLAKHRQITYLHPSTWKSLMKKEGLVPNGTLFIPKGTPSDVKKQITLNFVLRNEKSIILDVNRNGKPQPWMYDIADAYCIGKAGWSKIKMQ